MTEPTQPAETPEPQPAGTPADSSTAGVGQSLPQVAQDADNGPLAQTRREFVPSPPPAPTPEPAELLAYAKRATAAISGPADRRAARLELHEHAVARYADLVASGATPEDALRETLDRLGDPDDYAAELRRTSRPAMNVRNLAVVVSVVVLAILAVFAFFTWFFWVNGAITFNN